MLNAAILVTLAFAGSVQALDPLKPLETTPSVRLDPPVPIEDNDVWTEQLIMLLQMMCVVLNCSSALNEAEVSVQNWVDTYRNGGVRRDLSSEARAEARVRLQVMDELAARGAGGLSPRLRDEFRESIAAILEEIGR